MKLLVLLPLALLAFKCGAGNDWPAGQEQAMVEACQVRYTHAECVCAVHRLKQHYTWHEILSATGEPYQSWLREAVKECG